MARADFVWGRKLGQGSFGEVFEVTRIADGLRYVIKTMAAQGSSRKEQQDALNEVRLLAGLDHPRVVRYHDSFCEQGQLHIVMELCDGGDLSQLIERQEGVLLAEDDVWRHFAQTLLGLHHLHGAKILHRDLKTSNVFLTKRNIVKLGDFGIAASSKCRSWQCPSSATAPHEGAPGGSGQLRTPRKRPAHWAPCHCLGCSSEPPPSRRFHRL